MYNTHGISGCKVFDGEDLEYQDRYKLQQLQQKSWIEQQKYEHHLKQQEENEEQRKYAEQTLAINRMRSMLEAEHETRRRDMNVMQMEYNKKLAQMKRDKEAKEKYDETEMDLNNIRDAENIKAGAKKVVISAPAGNDLPTIVYSVNESTLTAED